MLAQHLQKQCSLSLPAIYITHQGCACTQLRPIQVNSQLFSGIGEQLFIFTFFPGASLWEWGEALHFHFHPRSFSRGMGNSSPFSSQELFSGNGEQLSIFIPGSLGVWGATLHFHLLPRKHSFSPEQLFIWISSMILQSSHHMAWSDYPQTLDSVEGSLQTPLSSSKTNKAFQGGQQG